MQKQRRTTNKTEILHKYYGNTDVQALTTVRPPKEAK